MKLEDVILCLPKTEIIGPKEGDLEGLADDSRQVVEGGVFVAVRGAAADGHGFILEALGAGAKVIIAEESAPEGFERTWIKVRDSRAALSILADLWWASPSRHLDVIGVTGTNGKTTVAYLVHAIIKSLRFKAGMIGTVVVDDGVKAYPAKNTTPGTLELQRLLATMQANGCGGVAMEVSSHGLEQGRVAGVDFNVGVFTNLTQDHLDYHGSMENYFIAKRLLFEQMAAANSSSVAVVNVDDRYGIELVKAFEKRLKILTYGFSSGCDFRAGRVKQTAKGMEFQLEAKGKSFLVRVPLIGRFNVMNTLAALGAVTSAGISLRDAISALNNVQGVPGRLELAGMSQGAAVFVDYAHTPDALQNVCKTLKELNPARLITIFGCGGDRDKSKRAPMARAAEADSDYCLVTSDNPRSENPASILKDVEKGFSGNAYRLIEDRAEAIQQAVALARAGDIVLIAGKGHEDYQQFADETISFDDRVEARKAIQMAEKEEKEARS